MYVSVLEKFIELGVEMMPHIKEGASDTSSAMFKALTEGLHSKEALDMVRDHVRSIMGPAAVAFPNTMLQMSKLQAAQVNLATQQQSRRCARCLPCQCNLQRCLHEACMLLV